MRNFGSSVSGLTFNLATVIAVWNKARIVPGWDPRLHRMDPCGAAMTWHEYGKTTTYGWEIDHVFPVSRGGRDFLSNLQPLQWQNNRHKADNLAWSCRIVYR